jgi:hypothetical protein
VPRNLATSLPTSMERGKLLEYSVNIPTVCYPEPEESGQNLNPLLKSILCYIILCYVVILYYIILYIVYILYKSAL